MFDESWETAQPPTTFSLKDLHLGAVIAKGCNAIVHAASWIEKDCAVQPAGCSRTRTASGRSDDSGTESSIEILVSDDEEGANGGYLANTSTFSHTTVTAPPPTLADLSESLDRHPLAVKMMFNYEAESNAPAILSAMHKEIVPSLAIDDRIGSKSKRLPRHPNIVAMQFSFADSVPDLPRGMALYPDALPSRLNRNGAGRNMTLFLVMKRYHCSLQEYLRTHDPLRRTCLLLVSQLMEGIHHLVRNGIAHRDLKTDNILVDLSQGADYPQLVITDFGCCLADNKLGLRLPYYTSETAKWGNGALMAPEVALAVPGPHVCIDYTKADLWAAATLIYEILGESNPFYRTPGGSRLDSRDYTESELPSLGAKASPVLTRLVGRLLRRDPRQRPSAAVAANVCAFLLFGPTEWSKSSSGQSPPEALVLRWLVTYAAKTILTSTKSPSSVEHGLAVTFLKRAKLDELLAAAHLMTA